MSSYIIWGRNTETNQWDKLGQGYSVDKVGNALSWMIEESIQRERENEQFWNEWKIEEYTV